MDRKHCQLFSFKLAVRDDWYMKYYILPNNYNDIFPDNCRKLRFVILYDYSIMKIVEASGASIYLTYGFRVTAVGKPA